MDVIERLRSVVDDEASLHESVCDLMGQLAAHGPPENTLKLIEALQYFDRLQQRTHSLCDLLESLVSENAPDELVLERFSESAPVAKDAAWMSAYRDAPLASGNAES